MQKCELTWQSQFNPKQLKTFTTTINAVKPTEYTENSEKKNHKTVGYWYLMSASLVFSIVILGGVTRLTESGLSIVEWNLIKGMKPPQTPDEWAEEFNKYKQFPEYKLLNHQISLEEFKRIFYYEWAHRMLGRFIGVFFIVPGLYFYKTGKMNRKLQITSLIIASMIGVLGWFMVKSGLDHDLVVNNQVPRVNHFWLSAHLGSAFVIYTAMLTTGLGIMAENSKSNSLLILKDQKNVQLRKWSVLLTALIFVTAISGAWVAGLDAGLIYNEFPYMGQGFVPSDMWAYSTKSDQNPNPSTLLSNLAKNPSAVQFNHRAITTFLSISTLFAITRGRNLSRQTRLAVNTLMAVACGQVTLGICTLLWFVPVPLAAAHQGGSLTLLSVAVWLIHTLKYIR